MHLYGAEVLENREKKKKVKFEQIKARSFLVVKEMVVVGCMAPGISVGQLLLKFSPKRCRIRWWVNDTWHGWLLWSVVTTTAAARFQNVSVGLMVQ